MQNQAKSSPNRGSVLRPVLAALLVLSGLVLLARAGNPGATAPSSPNAVTSAPGVPRFQNYPAPAGIADDVGEPSIGCNWKSDQSFNNSMFSIPNGGRVMLFGGFSPDLYRATFNDCSSPAKPNWEAKPLVLANAPRAAGDPILFTDHDTGRTFVSQLVGLTPAGSTTDITDDDGDNFTPSEGSSLPSDIDHQTFGGGRYHDPTPATAGAYPNAVYYASQSVSDARAARSDDGGVTFGPATPMYTVNQCAGLHGHIKVSPKDGTVYVPNVGCGGAVPFHETGAQQAVIVSEDNGITWSVRPIPDSTTHGNGSADNSIIGTRDPSVSIDGDGNVYFVYQAEDRATGVTNPADKAGDTHPKVAVSHDKGLHWEPSIDVGANVINGGPIKNATFVAATAGDGGRASVAFFGTETGGNNWPCGDGDDCSLSAQGVSTGINARDLFTGVWYLYISSTFDGGKTWTTQNVTPGDPVQRGGICGSSTCRNLLDFMDLQIDKEGRVLVAGEDGCIGTCVQGGANSFTAKGFITRQSGGKRMIAQYDPVEPALPGAPAVSATLNDAKTVAQLSWPTPDDGASAIVGYNIYRRIGDAGLFLFLGTTTTPGFTDTSFDPAMSVAYRVTAINGLGEGPFCDNIVPVVAPPPVDPCVPPGASVVTDPAGDQLGGPTANKDLDILTIFVAEPFVAGGPSKLVFTMQLTDLSTIPPNRQWRIIWTPKTAPSLTEDRYYVGANSNAGGDPSAVTFEYGTVTSNGNVPTKQGDADAGVLDPKTGTIQITISNSKVGDPKAGDSLSVLSGRNFAGTGSATLTKTSATDSTADANYGLAGNAACKQNQAPVAKLVATPIQGNPPLTVHFDASTSVDPDAGDSIASYTFSFGDGSPDVTQSSPTISHTYTHGGGFFATLSVTDSHGTQSVNAASVEIKVAAQLFNLSTRLQVQPGDKALIGGFIIKGTEPKKVILRGLGPSINVPGKLEDPVITLYNSSNTNIGGNDDWKTDQQNVESTGLAPTNDRESALVITLNPGTYTVVMRGKNDTSGIGVVEVWDVNLAANSRLANVSSRGFIGINDNVLIGGFFAGPQTAAVTGVVFRAIGPSLAAFNVPQPMQDPTIEIHNKDGDIIAANDDWQTSQKSDIEAVGLAPSDSRESAILLRNFEPGPYTAIVRGKGNTVGVGLVEIYDVQQ